MNVRSVQQHSTGTLIGLLIAANIVVLFALVPVSWLQKAFWVASPFCPQRPSHSVFIGGQQMPIEARMFGMFGGALLAIAYFAARGRLNAAALPSGRYLAVCIALFGVMAFDGIQATLFDAGVVRLYTPNLVLRLSTGLASGMGIAMILVPLTNQTLWREPTLTKAVFTSWKDLALLLALEAMLCAITLSDWPPALMPLSLLNSLAIVTLMTTLMALIACLLMNRIRQFVAWQEALGPFVAGFIVATLFIGAVAMVRLILFGPGPLG